MGNDIAGKLEETYNARSLILTSDADWYYYYVYLGA